VTEILRYAAFTSDPAGGNPAGVVLDASGLDETTMRAIAAEVGYSETAFVTSQANDTFAVRYFSPESEVPFCGHATIATAVAYAERHQADELRFDTPAGRVDVRVTDSGDGPLATLTSVPPHVDNAADEDVAEALAALGWQPAELDPALPPRVAYAGARHLVLAAATRERLADLDYDFARLRALMTARDWVTIALVFRRDQTTYDARNPFPTGGVVEDPATGAAAAAFGAYLRALGAIDPPARLTIHQGDDLGRPSLLLVDIPVGVETGIRVSGRAVPMDQVQEGSTI
jgi:PhzF family phenazine biosynthesis protein